YLTARAVEVRLHDLQHEACGGRRVEGVAARFQDRQAGRGGQPVRGRDHAERPRELWPGGELRDPGHNAAPSVCEICPSSNIIGYFPGMDDDLEPRVRAVCDLNVAEAREYGGGHGYYGGPPDHLPRGRPAPPCPRGAG